MVSNPDDENPLTEMHVPREQTFFTEKTEIEQLERVLKADPASIARTIELGSQFDFSEAVPSLRSIQTFLSVATSTESTSWPQAALMKLKGVVKTTDSLLKEARSFKPDSSDPNSVRQHIITRFRNQIHELSELAAPTVYILTLELSEASLSSAHGQVQQQAASALAELEKTKHEMEASYERLRAENESIVHKQLNELSQLKIEANQALTAAREAAGGRAVSAHADEFHKAAMKHATFAKVWLGASIGTLCMAFAVVSGAIWWHATHPPLEAQPANLQLAVAQLSLLSLCFFLVVFTGRTYRANRHLQTLYEHRAIALTTFSAFAEAADGDTKAAVLLQSTTAIFSHQPSGFLSQESDGPASPLSILEVVRSGKTPQ